jgi:uncharacterized protein YjbI with pentapeptide repeats
MSEQQSTPPDPIAWRHRISEERQTELQAILEAWNAPGADHDNCDGPFDGLKLTGADLRWLANQTGYDGLGHAPNLHLESAHLNGAQLERAHLSGAHLERVKLFGAQLKRATFYGAHLEGADLRAVDAEGADFADAYLSGANFRLANLKQTDLREAWLDGSTVLSEAVLDSRTRLGDIQWNGVGTVNLTQLNWPDVHRLGDETALKRGSGVEAYEAAVRAYRQVGAQLRAQGMTEVADRFALRAQIVQRRVLLKERRPLAYLGSWLLALLAGYGYAPARTIFWYLVFVLGFAGLYLRFGVVDHHPFRPLEALVFSLTSFHGRGFFPGGLHLDDPVTVLAAGEAVLGLLIEISFIATFTQRFFGAK